LPEERDFIGGDVEGTGRIDKDGNSGNLVFNGNVNTQWLLVRRKTVA
jgi:hypothetical protein